MEKPKIKLPPEQRQNERPRIVLPPSSVMPEIVIRPKTEARITNIVARVPVEFEGRQLTFHKQLNSSDCGPAMCLNMQQLLGATPPIDSRSGERVDNVPGVRRWLTEHWAGSLGPDSDAEQWLNVGDIARYIFDGLDLTNEDVNTMQDVDSLLNRQGRKFVWGYSNYHFKGFYQGEDRSIYEIDSLKEGPLASSENDLRQYAARTFDSPDASRRSLHVVSDMTSRGPQPTITILDRN